MANCVKDKNAVFFSTGVTGRRLLSPKEKNTCSVCILALCCVLKVSTLHTCVRTLASGGHLLGLERAEKIVCDCLTFSHALVHFSIAIFLHILSFSMWLLHEYPLN